MASAYRLAWAVTSWRTRWPAQIDHADCIAEYLARAFQAAVSGRRGPVVLALPENVLFARTAALSVAAAPHSQPSRSVEEVRQLANLLQCARRPVVILGGGGRTHQARENTDPNERPAQDKDLVRMG